jgi:hypothetical protein
VLLSYGYWQRRFGGSQSIVGRAITVDSRPQVVVGVMPRGFLFVNEQVDLIAPLVVDYAKLSLPGFGFQCVARLKPGVTITQASADIARLPFVLATAAVLASYLPARRAAAIDPVEALKAE